MVIKGGMYGSAFQVASIGSCKKVIQTLLDNGAQVNAENGPYGNIL